MHNEKARAMRAALIAEIAACRAEIVDLTLQLVAAASPNPPGDTNRAAEVAADLIRETVPGVDITFHPGSDAVMNLVARVHGKGSGRRLVLNGHLDTYPVGDRSGWSTSPEGEVRDDRIYGRGTADMKGGIAASILALAALSRHRDLWTGEVVLALAGDEETMGHLGTQHLIETVPHASGDAVIIADAGSPSVLRFGEKGFVWMEVEATGRASHGAHVHLGINALERLMAALSDLVSLRHMPVAAPENVRRAIVAARPISEALSGAGEAEVLSRVTVNIGRLQGGTSPNLVPALARGAVDIRLPVGVSVADVETAIARVLGNHEGVTWTIIRQMEPSFSEVSEAIIRHGVAAATEVLGRAPAVNMRVGGSDARLYRRAGQPTIVYGPTPRNMGGPDEHVMIDELVTVAQVLALAGSDFLSDQHR
jgi:succinyl-diaminopimelate desuccinylase